MAKPKFDLSQPMRYGLEGRIVTMDAAGTILPKGIVYINGKDIVAVLPTDDPAPDGFSKSDVIKTGGTIYPGLIELHNHITYNILPLWQVPKAYGNRDQWRSYKDYRKLVSGPLSVVGRIGKYVEAIVRFVECKCLFGGVTTTQGVSLSSNKGIKKFYMGVVRNVEKTSDPDKLRPAKTRIADIESRVAKKFLERLNKTGCMLLHLSEGIDERANKHFKALKINSNQWAITDSLAGIHANGLRPEDLEVMSRHKGSIIWSPTSNLLLYGRTLDIRKAKEEGILLGMGSDWSVSGPKNMLEELKVAYLVSKDSGEVFTPKELVEMATINAAKILKWDQFLGSIEAGKKADMLVVGGRKDDPYMHLIDARETSVSLVIIDGIPRLGQTRLMNKFEGNLEAIKLGKSKRSLYLEHPESDPVLVKITYRESIDRLREGMARIPELALQLENAASPFAMGMADASLPTTTWALDLHHEDNLEGSQRHHLALAGEAEPTGGSVVTDLAAGVPVSQIVVPIKMDIDTVANDRNHFKELATQRNFPEYLKFQLPEFYGVKVKIPSDTSVLNNVDTSNSDQFDYIKPLSAIYDLNGTLTPTERLLIIDQAIQLFENIYVHLPLKASMHASNPIQQLQTLRHGMNVDSLSEIDFHREMITIFNSVRDLHTNYILPMPYRDKIAFLPFYVEEYYEDDQPKYIVSKVIGNKGPKFFEPGVEIQYWNGIPIERIIKINGDKNAGSNPAARHIRGLDSLTFRPLSRVLPPDEEWVVVQYVDLEGKKRQTKQPWLIASQFSQLFKEETTSGAGLQFAMGYDHQTQEVHQVKKYFFAPKAVAYEHASAKAKKKPIKLSKGTNNLATTLPGYFRVKRIKHKGKQYGYIKIFSFYTPDDQAFVDEFVRLLQNLPDTGLVLDVRGNGGGNIYACERILQTLTNKRIHPQAAQFINSYVTESICQQHSPSNLFPGLDLSEWKDSFDQLKATGSIFSLGYPITPKKLCNDIGRKYFGPVLLITDALCYSATDIFAAGFKDHGIGKILGVGNNTGAGGANVWSYGLLQQLTAQGNGASGVFKPLVKGSDFRVAVRRTLRQGSMSGVPVEDLGIKPDYVYQMTKEDLLHSNKNLIRRAVEILEEEGQ